MGNLCFCEDLWSGKFKLGQHQDTECTVCMCVCESSFYRIFDILTVFYLNKRINLASDLLSQQIELHSRLCRDVVDLVRTNQVMSLSTSF